MVKDSPFPIYNDLTNINSMTFLRALGYDILYCDYEKRSEQSGIRQWIIPLGSSVWAGAMISFVVVIAFYVISEKKNLMLFVLEIFQMMVKQPITNVANLNSLVL